jgi:hypothetical protein
MTLMLEKKIMNKLNRLLHILSCIPRHTPKLFVTGCICVFLQSAPQLANTAETQENVDIPEDSFEESLYGTYNDFDSITLNCVLFSHSDGKWTIWLNDTEFSSEQGNAIKLCKIELLITEVTEHHVKLMHGNEEITLHPRQTFRFDRPGTQQKIATTTSSN